MAALINGFIVCAALLRTFFGNSLKFRFLSITLVHKLSIVALRVLGFRLINSTETPQDWRQDPSFVVSNHLSYLDVLIISSLRPTVFVTSVEVRDSGFLGLLCKLAGCHFIERRNRNNIKEEVEKIAQTLKENFSVCVFPEGTTSTGAAVLPFRASLFDAAIGAGVRITPICLNYLDIGGKKIDATLKDKIFWYGDMTFFSHLWQLLFVRWVTVRATNLRQIALAPNSDRKSLANEAFQKISDHYIQIA